MTDTGEVKYRVTVIRPNWPGDPDGYVAHHDSLEEATEDAKGERDAIQDDLVLEPGDECTDDANEGLPYVVVEESYVDSDGDVAWEEIETYATTNPACEHPPTECKDTADMNAGERMSLRTATVKALRSHCRAMPYSDDRLRELAVMLFAAGRIIEAMDPTTVCEHYHAAEARIEEEASAGQIGHAHYLNDVCRSMLHHAARKSAGLVEHRHKRYAIGDDELGRHPIAIANRKARRNARLFIEAADAL